jgi:hypothetical protein
MIRAIAALAALVSAASPTQGSLFGPIVSVKGATFTITTSLSPNGKAVVSAASAKITEQAAAPRTSLKVGACVMATGTRNSKGVVTASRITITQPVKGSCTGGFAGGRRGTRPVRPAGGGTRTTPPGGFAGGSGGFAFGAVTKISGATLTVKGASFGSSASRTTTVTVSSKVSLLHTVTVKASALQTKTCAFVRGTSTDKGKTVKATNVAITPETNGKCANGFGGAGR